MIPAGRYKAHAVRVPDDNGNEIWVQWGYTKSSETEQIVVTFEIAEGDHKGQQLPWFGYFTEKSWARTIQSLQYCGFEGDDLSTIEDQNLGEEVSIVVEHHEYNDKKYARVSWVNAPGGGQIKLAHTMSTNDRRSFAAQMRDRIRGLNAEAGKETAPAPVDNIPF